MGIFLAFSTRLLVPLLIPRWPLAGGLLAIAADTVDILFYQLFGFPGFWDYQRIDKLLDAYYLAIEVAVVQGWQPWPRGVASALFGARMLGMTLFEVTDTRLYLFVFPNLFELFYLLHLAFQRWRPARPLARVESVAWMGALLVPKMGQEWALHYAKLLDNLVAIEIIEDGARAVLERLGDLMWMLRCASG